MKAMIRVFTPDGKEKRTIEYSMTDYTAWIIRAKERNYVFNYDDSENTVYVLNDSPARNEFIVNFS